MEKEKTSFGMKALIIMLISACLLTCYIKKYNLRVKDDLIFYINHLRIIFDNRSDNANFK